MIHVLVGEPLQRSRAFGRLKQELMPAAPDFNVDLLGGKEFSAARCMECCGQLPVLAARRLVVVTEAELIRKGELELLADRMTGIPASTELIFVAEKLDRRLRFWQKAGADWRDFRPLYPREVPRWVAEEARGRGLRMSAEGVSWLAERFGTELGLIASALEKLSLVAKGTLGLKELEEAVSGSSFSSVFELTDAVGNGNRIKALKLYRRMTLGGESPVGLLALVARHFRILLKVKETGSGAPPYFLKNYREQASRFPPGALTAGMEKIFRTDRELKRSPLPTDSLMERLLLELCQSRGEPRDVPGGVAAV